MATVTRIESQPVGEEGGKPTYEDAYEIIDGIPVGRPTDDDPATIAYEDAYEIVDGQVVERPEMSEDSVEIASILQGILGPFVRRQKLGRAIVEPRFKLKPKQQRRPDLAFISAAKWPLGRRAPSQAAWDLVPDLAVEVISTNDRALKVIAKVREYFDAGVRAVWLIYPNVDVVHVYHAWDRVEVVTRAGTLDGGEVVPGFRLPLVELFEEEAEPEVAGTPEPAPEPSPTA